MLTLELEEERRQSLVRMGRCREYLLRSWSHRGVEIHRETAEGQDRKRL